MLEVNTVTIQKGVQKHYPGLSLIVQPWMPSKSAVDSSRIVFLCLPCLE